MGRTAASLLIPALLDHLHGCVFLVPAWTDDGTVHIVSSICNFSIFVSIQHNYLHFWLNLNAAKQNNTFIFIF